MKFVFSRIVYTLMEIFATLVVVLGLVIFVTSTYEVRAYYAGAREWGLDAIPIQVVRSIALSAIITGLILIFFVQIAKASVATAAWTFELLKLERVREMDRQAALKSQKTADDRSRLPLDVSLPSLTQNARLTGVSRNP